MPLRNPSSVKAAFDDSIIPWQDATCANSPWTIYDAAVTESTPNWAAWKLSSNFLSGQKCIGTVKNTTLKQAVLDCTEAACSGVSWLNASLDSVSTGVWSFISCGVQGNTTANAAWTAAFKNLNTAPDTTTFQTIGVDFAPQQKSNYTPDEGFVLDSGAAFAMQGNLKFGWRCGVLSDASTLVYSPAGTNSTTINPGEYAPCSPGARNEWNVQVPNGLYKLTIRMAKKMGSVPLPEWSGCSIENVAFPSVWSNWSQFGTFFSQAEGNITVEVLDGTLTLQAQPEPDGVTWTTNCYGLAALIIDRIGGPLNNVWYPSENKPWIQYDLGAPKPVGLVHIDNRAVTDCGNMWLYGASSCIETNAKGAIGEFQGPNAGYIIAVSNTPCTAAGCSSTATVCQQTSWAFVGRGDGGKCNGTEGRYVYLQLQGTGRIISPAKVNVNSFGPKSSSHNNTMVCFGLAAPDLAPDGLKGEFTISDDPEDPIFYSTCWSRELNITWLPSPALDSGSGDDWDLPTGKCLDCSSYRESPWGFKTSHWKVADECVDCDKEWQPEAPANIVAKTYQSRRCDYRQNSCGFNGTSDLARCKISLMQQDEVYPRSLDECRTAVQGHTNCSGTFWFSDNVMTLKSTASLYLATCVCYAKHECCGHCSPVADANSNSFSLYQIDGGKPDPMCAAGVSNGTLCCEIGCTKCSNACPTTWPALVNGSCCGGNLVKACSQGGAPCNMTL